MSASTDPAVDEVVILPLVVVAQAFPARPSSLPDVRAFLRKNLTSTPISEDDIRALCDRVADVLLDAAGVSSSLQVSLRILPDGAEIDVVGSTDGAPESSPAGRGGRIAPPAPRPQAPVEPLPPAPPLSFAAWLAAGLRREELTMEAAARRLNVSTKTVGRWVSGTTEPRMRDLYRIREVFGKPPLE